MISPDLIGREEELARLSAVLDQHRPAVVIVTGRVGIGRHALVVEACRRAPTWTLAPPRGTGLYVEPGTTADGFAQRLHDALGEAVVPEGAAEGEVPSSDPALIAALLAQRPPLVLVLERYRPLRATDRWFADALVPALEQLGAAVVLAILDAPGEATRLTRLAVERFELGPLTPEEVRPAIAEALRSANPPVEEAELEVYVRGIAEQPGEFDSLLRLLTV